jgi:hypothetical protein
MLAKLSIASPTGPARERSVWPLLICKERQDEPLGLYSAFLCAWPQ